MGAIGNLDVTCSEYLDAAMRNSTPPSAVLTNAVFGVGIICIVATLCGPGLCVLQWRRGTLWFFQLKRTSRGTYVACHPLNVFLLFSILSAICISILGVMTKLSSTGHEELIPGLLVLQMAAWVFTGISGFYLAMGTFLALPEGSEVPGLVRLSKALRPLSHPYVINPLTFGAPFAFIASSIPNIVVAPIHITLATSISNIATAQMRSLAMQDPAALIPADTKLLLIQSHENELEGLKHIGISFVFTALFALMILVIGGPTAYSLIYLLRKQLKQEGKRVVRVPVECLSGAAEKSVGVPSRVPGLDVQMHTSTEVRVDGPDMQEDDGNKSASQRASSILPTSPSFSNRPRSGSKFGTCPVSPLKFAEPSTPTSPRSVIKSLPSSATDKDATAIATLPSLPRAPFVESPPIETADRPSFFRNVRRRMSWSLRSQSGTESQRDNTAALIRFKYMRRCFYTLTTFYSFVCLGGALYLGLSLFVALVHLMPQNPLVNSISNLELVFECVAAATLVMNFTLVGVKVFDSGTI